MYAVLTARKERTMTNNNATMYHNQAEIDEYAKTSDMKSRIIEATFDQILESYNEYMNDLFLELQEAY